MLRNVQRVQVQLLVMLKVNTAHTTQESNTQKDMKLNLLGRFIPEVRHQFTQSFIRLQNGVHIKSPPQIQILMHLQFSVQNYHQVCMVIQQKIIFRKQRK